MAVGHHLARLLVQRNAVRHERRVAILNKNVCAVTDVILKS